MARNNVQTTVTVGMDVQLAKRNAEALKQVIIDLKNQLKEAKVAMDTAASAEAYKKAGEQVDSLILKIKTLEKVQRSATPASAYEAFISGDPMNSNTLRQAQRGAKNRLNTVPTGSSDQTMRTFINDINRTQMELNRLQAGFSKPLQSVKRELNSLSGGELQRLHNLLQQEQSLVQGNDRAWASYASAIAKVDERMREYDTLARQQMGAATLSQSQRGGFATANERDINRAIEKLREYRAVINDPNGTGKATWEATTREIQKLQANLDTLKQKTKEMTGETMNLAAAEKIGKQALAGTFSGSTKQLTIAKKTLEEQILLVDRGSARYKELQIAIQGVENEEKRMGMTAKEVRSVLDSPKGKSFNELKIAVEQGRMELARMRTDTKEGKKAFDDLAAKVKEADVQMKQLGNSSKGTATSFEKAWSRLKTYIGLYVGAAVAMQKLTATLGDLMELSDKMGEVRKTTGFTADEVGRLSDNLKKLDTRTSLTSLMELSSLAGSVGLKTQEDVQGFTEAAQQLMVALPEMGNESARTLIKIATATGDLKKNNNDVRETLEKVGSTIIALRANSASAAPAITDFVARVGAVGAQAGISIDQIAALGSTIDALGGRVEMSATALSRMIPAIRNNAFGVANAIGVTEKTLVDLFNQGKSMEAMVLIFEKMRASVKNFDTSTEEGMNAMANDVEALLGKNASMAEVMKELNQQGARAGIVFGLLSQNVDVLKDQLGIAGEAYEKNTALLNEFNNMNETTAAKWARLKNQVEEAFVGDSAQRFLGGIIDGLRKIVDLLTGNGGVSVALRSILMYIALVRLQIISVAKGALTSLGSGLKNIGVMLGFIKGEMTALQWSNIFTAAAAAVAYFAYQLKQTHNTLAEARKELGRWAQEILKSEQAVEQNFVAVDKARKSIDEANKKVLEARAALEKARKEMDGSKESAERLKKAEDDLKKAEEGLASANDAHRASIEQINKLYGSYLGFMLSEVARSEELINARDLINAKLRETITLKRKEAALSRIEENSGEKRDEAYGELSQALSGAIRQQVVVGRTKDKNGKIVEQKGWTTNAKASEELLRQITKLAQAEKMTAEQVEKALANAGLNIYEKGSNGTQRITAYGANLRNLVMNYRKEYMAVEKDVADVERQFDAQMAVDREDSQKYLKKQYREAEKTYAQLEENHAKAQGDAKKKAAADLLKQSDTLQDMMKNAKNYYDLNNEDEQKAYDKFISDSQKRIDGIEAQREALLKEAGEAYSPRTKVGGGSTVPNPTNPYGSYNRVTSPYQDWDADALVSRRKEMLERVRALANGADVQKVLSEDAKFISEATRKNIKDTKQAIEWYNTERLKIQEALHEKHLTNTGDWMDPKKGRKRASRLVQDEMKYYLDELDAYYTERKTRIQEAGTEEGVTEAEVKNRILANEMEWHQRRAELQKLYAKKSAEVAKEERDAIFDILSDRTGDTTDYIEKDIANTVKFIEKIGKEKGKPAMDRILGDLDLGIERDFLKQQQAVTTQMKAIQDIIEKERPYDGITRNLRENLVTMGILTADMAEERNRLMRENADMSDFNSRQAAAELKRTAFVLREAENAYSTDIEEVMRHMGEQGMQAWADAIRGDDKMQRALMAQLRSTYDAIQDAIKKEASLIKKQTDIWWADIEKGQTQSRRDGFEKTLSRLGLAEDQVKRANSLIGAGQASERVADKLAIKQMQVRLAMQTAYYTKMRQIGEARIRQLEAEGKLEDAEHLRRSLNLAKTEELKKLEEQRVAIANQMEESQNRLYTALKEWADLFSSSLQSIFEASHAGDAEYYNELAKLNLTGKGGPGAGTYVIIDNAGTSKATAHYEYLDEFEALERQREIERHNAQAEAWKKVMDDINMKMSETITDQMNAMLQNQSVDANTDATLANTLAILGLTEKIGGQAKGGEGIDTSSGTGMGLESGGVTGSGGERTGDIGLPPSVSDADPASFERYAQWVQTYNEGQEKMRKKTEDTNNKITASSQSAFAKMTQAANLYGIAYQAMSNDNMSTAQKFGMIAVQAAGQAAITSLTVSLSQQQGQAAADLPGVLGKIYKELGPIGGSIAFAAFTGLLGGLMGLAASKIAKSKSQIAQATGASGANAGRLTTGMLTYAEGNVNEFTDPASLQVGRQYNVDGSDGKTYRARYMGKNPRTHITSGPEFHLVGEAGREAIIDAKTTRNIRMNEPEIWRSIQILYNGGSLSHVPRRKRGMAAFADGNLDDFTEMGDGDSTALGNAIGVEQIMAMQASLDRNSEVLERALTEGIRGVFDVYGKGGLIDSYDTGKKTVNRHGERY